jgi:hypothetical protein
VVTVQVKIRQVLISDVISREDQRFFFHVLREGARERITTLVRCVFVVSKVYKAWLSLRFCKESATLARGSATEVVGIGWWRGNFLQQLINRRRPVTSQKFVCIQSWVV